MHKNPCEITLRYLTGQELRYLTGQEYFTDFVFGVK
jgi:hypothetical protein